MIRQCVYQLVAYGTDYLTGGGNRTVQSTGVDR